MDLLRSVFGGNGAAEGEGGCLEKWEEVGRVCAAVLQRHIAHIPKCRCGF